MYDDSLNGVFTETEADEMGRIVILDTGPLTMLERTISRALAAKRDRVCGNPSPNIAANFSPWSLAGTADGAGYRLVMTPASPLLVRSSWSGHTSEGQPVEIWRLFFPPTIWDFRKLGARLRDFSWMFCLEWSRFSTSICPPSPPSWILRILRTKMSQDLWIRTKSRCTSRSQELKQLKLLRTRSLQRM